MAIYDLRKNNVTNAEEAIEFLELVESRLGQIKKIIKDQKFKNVVLVNRLNAAEGKKEVVYVDRDTNDVINGATVNTDDAESTNRLEQLRAAASTEAGLPIEEVSEIGQLNVDVEQEKVPKLPKQEDVESIGTKVARKTNGITKKK